MSYYRLTLLLAIESEDFEYLIKAKPVALPQAIISGCRLTTNPRLYVGSFDVRPFVTYMFFSQLGLIVAPAQGLFRFW